MGIIYSAFGKNDIRGIYGNDITEELFFYTGKGFVKYLETQTKLAPRDMWITVTQDARNHSPSLTNALIKGVTATGANVVDLGLAPTPIGYYSEVVGVNANITDGNDITGALIVTASHNPSQYNGLKMTCSKQSLNENQIKEVQKFTQEAVEYGVGVDMGGQVKQYDLIPDYIADMKQKFGRIGEGIKVVVDSANATGGVVAPRLYRDLGCDVVELYSVPNGNFPNHHPNPSDEKTLTDIKKAVIENQADLGIAFDGDSDRIGVIDSKGRSMTGDKLLLIYALDVIESYRLTKVKPVVVSEVKCSQVLYDVINSLEATAIMQKTGHGYIKSKMKETGAVLAGEMSGHIFFKDRYHGFDDAVYAGIRAIEIVAKGKKLDPDFKIEQLLSDFDKIHSSQEVRFKCPNDLKKPTLESFKTLVAEAPNLFGAKIKEIITLDGMRIVFDDGFALIRQSNTEPVFTLRFEAKNKTQCEMYENAMISNLEKCLKAIEG